ncbi:hypothetical protein Csa_014015 [Cucumis sativus]|uniref:Uncharacterized protein n=1 Tax=Cucumis sativus TaxID=3659 RepID=A0A0A0LQ99_CUCSA|nr:hypothetical protein Csa_014015 [Cucumis sativus]
MGCPREERRRYIQQKERNFELPSNDIQCHTLLFCPANSYSSLLVHLIPCSIWSFAIAFVGENSFKEILESSQRT